MKPLPSYLTLNRHGTFYFRMVIPRPLRALLNGKREVRRSLKTDSHRLAIKRARQHAVRFESVFDRVLSVLKPEDQGPTEADIADLEEIVFPTEKTALPDFSDYSEPKAKPEPVLSAAENKERQRWQYIATLLAGGHDRPIPSEQEPMARRLYELSITYHPTELPRVLSKLRDDLIRGLITPAGAALAPANMPSFDPSMANWTLYQVWQHQLERDRADISSTGGQANRSGSLEENERFARVMTVLTEHKPVCQLDKRDWQKAYDLARKMKVGAEASIDPPTPREDILTDDIEQMVGHERTNAFISTMGQIQDHARYLDLTTIGPSDLLIKQVEKRKSSRTRKGKAFSATDIEAIFSGYIYQGALPTNRTKAYPFWFWLPLVGYFTGARTNEIAQLDTADIRLIDGHPCFDFCPDDPKAFEAKRVKTEEARQVPIHPRLIELGFLEYVDSQRQAKQKKLFGDGLTYLPSRDEDTDHNKEGWAKSASKFFNESPKGYLVEIGVHV